MRTPSKWHRDIHEAKLRAWEDSYRETLRVDRIVRSTHDFSCPGGCEFEVGIRSGKIVYQRPLGAENPRCCASGLAAQACADHPGRVLHPRVRGSLLDLWAKQRKLQPDPVKAWKALVEDSSSRSAWTSGRGLGGFRQTSWETACEIIAGALLHTLETAGPDRIFGYSSNPASSLVSYASGARFLQLLGGVQLSSLDWEGLVSNAAAQTWGEGLDASEASSWREAELIALQSDSPFVVSSPDARYITEARLSGAEIWLIGDVYSPACTRADRWVRLDSCRSLAWWLAVNHVILREAYTAGEVDSLVEYLVEFTDAPFLVELREHSGGWRVGSLSGGPAHPSSSPTDPQGYLVWDAISDRPVALPCSTESDESATGWHLRLINVLDGSPVSPLLTFRDTCDQQTRVDFPAGPEAGLRQCNVPVRTLTEADGRTLRLATVFDLMLAHYGLSAPDSDRDPPSVPEPYTPEWAEQVCGVPAQQIVRFARRFLQTAIRTGGKCLVLTGPESNRAPHAELTHRAIHHALMLCGCIGKVGGGWSYCGPRRKPIPLDSLEVLGFARDWVPLGRRQNTALWSWLQGVGELSASGEERSESSLATPGKNALSFDCCASFPEGESNNLDPRQDGRASVLEPSDNAERRPRVLLTWGSDFFFSQGRATRSLLECFLTGSNRGNSRPAGGSEDAQGRLDLFVNLSSRLDGSALFCDVVLPAAVCFERSDITSSEATCSLQAIAPARVPAGEALSEWQAFRRIARTFSRLARQHFPRPLEDLVPRFPEGSSWERRAKPSSSFEKVTRDYSRLANCFDTIGPLVRDPGILVRGVRIRIPSAGFQAMPSSIARDRDACSAFLALSTVANREISESALSDLAIRTGRSAEAFLQRLAGGFRFEDLEKGARRPLLSPLWTGDPSPEQSYVPFQINLVFGVPWNTATGRQQFFLNTRLRQLPADKFPSWKMTHLPDGGKGLQLRHVSSKWGFGTVLSELDHLRTQSRGSNVVWISCGDASRIGVQDNDWVELRSREDDCRLRCVVSSVVPEGLCAVHLADPLARVPGSPLDLEGTPLPGSIGILPLVLEACQFIGPCGEPGIAFNEWGPSGARNLAEVVVRRIQSCGGRP